MSDVLIGQAYFLRFDPKLWAARQPYPPLGALYAAAAVRSAGHDVALFDAMLASCEADWGAALEARAPRVAVIYEDNFNYLSKMCLLRMRQAALAMIDMARARGVPVIVAGSDASDHPALYLERGAAAVIVGEGEVTLVELLGAILGGRDRPLCAIDGVAVLGADGAVVRGRPREIVRDLDTLPLPARDLVDIERYRRVWLRHHGYFSLNLATTRGCPYHCNWCAKPIYGQRYSARSPESVVQEMALLKRTCRPDHLWIVDDIFGLKPGWLERFAALVVERDAAIPFKCLQRADQVTAQTVTALRAAGARTVWIGAESGSQRVLDAMEKGTRVEQIAAAARHLHAAGLEVGFFLQFGYPGEMRDDIERTLQMVRDCAPDDIGISVSYPLPGTPFYERVRAQLGDKQNWVDSDDLAIMYRATYSTGFYRTLHALAHAEFRGARAAADLRRAARRPSGLRPRHFRSAARYVYRRAQAFGLRRRLERLAGGQSQGAPLRPLAVLTPQAAAVPTEQTQ